MVAATASDTAREASQEFIKKAGELRQLVEDLASSAPDAAKEQIVGLKHHITALCDEGKDCTVGIANRVVDTVRAYPLQVAAAAVGAGLITWWLLSRKG